MTRRIVWLSSILLAGASAATPPVITGASPDPIDAGGPYFLMTITGSGFVSGAVARLAATALSTTFVSSSELLAAITPELRALSGSPSLTVANPDNSVSNGRPIHILPVLVSLNPSAALAIGAAVGVTITGIGLTAGDVLLWIVSGQQSVILANFVDSKTLTAVIPAGLLSTSQAASVQIADPLTGLTSGGGLPFEVLAPPTIASLSPNPVDAGGTYFLLTVTGTGFVPHSVVNWAGAPLGTTYVSSTQLQAAITPELRALSGTFPLTVAPPGVAPSDDAPFTVSPVLFTVSPASATGGGAAVNITAAGVGFTHNDVLSFSVGAQQSLLSTTYVSSTTLTAAIPAAALRATGAATVLVSDSTGAGRSLPQPFSIVANALPAITTIVPASATAGSPAFTLTVTGANCPAGCVVQWNGSPLATTHPADTTVTASVPGSLIAAAGAASIQLVNPSGGASNTATFTINSTLGAPAIASLSPNPVDAGGAYFLVTVTGTGFGPNSVVNWAGAPLGTTYVSSTQLQAAITSQLRALSGTFPLTVATPGVAPSSATPFTVSPVLLTVSPLSASIGGAAVNLTAAGVGFTRNSVLTFNAAALSTIYVSSTTLTAVIPAAALRTTGAATVLVSDSTGTGHSLAQSFAIFAPPAIATISPTSATAGSAAFTLTVTGANCPAGCVVQWNGSPLATTHPADTTVTASVPGNLLAGAGAAGIQLVNQYGGASNIATFTINPAAAWLTGLNPGSVAAGSAAFPLTVYGSGFVAGSMVLWNGAALGTSYNSGVQVTALVTADLVGVRAGTSASITVRNPGGAESNSVILPIDPPRPAILSLTPASAAAGGPALAIVIAGSNFAANCVVRWNGTAVATTFADAAHVSASVPASLLVSAGVLPITLTNPSGLVTSPVTFTVIPSTPVAVGVSPASVTEGAPAFTLTVNGAYFAPASTVLWNGAALATTFVSTAQATAVVPANLVAAAGRASITVSNPGGLMSQAVGFAIASAPPPAPAVASGGVVNAFSSLPSIAPGSLISIFGTNLAAGDGSATATPLPVSLNGTSVSIDGTLAPLLFVSATQINAQAPLGTPLGTVALVVRNGALQSAPVKVDVRAAAPGILALSGGSHALAVNYPGGVLNAPENPVHPGEYVVVYVTGQGLVDRPVTDGAESPANPLSLPLAAVQATLGGKPAAVAFAGLAPGFVGLLQVNLLIPDIAGGEQPLAVTVADVAANATVVSVAANR